MICNIYPVNFNLAKELVNTYNPPMVKKNYCAVCCLSLMLVICGCGIRSFKLHKAPIIELNNPEDITFYELKDGKYYYPDTALVLNKDIFISDKYAGRIVHYERRGTGYKVIAQFGQGNTQGQEVTAYTEMKVQTWEVTNQFGVQVIQWTNKYTNYPSTAARFTEIGSIAVDSQRHLAAENIILHEDCDMTGDASFIYTFHSDGTFIGRIGVDGPVSPDNLANTGRPFSGLKRLQFSGCDQLYAVCLGDEEWNVYCYNFTEPSSTVRIPAVLDKKTAKEILKYDIQDSVQYLRVEDILPSPKQDTVVISTAAYGNKNEQPGLRLFEYPLKPNGDIKLLFRKDHSSEALHTVSRDGIIYLYDYYTYYF